MTYPEGNGVINYGSSRDRGDQGYTLRQAFEDGGIKAGAARAAGLAYKVLSRRKAAEEGVARLARVLSALDLTALGVGSTLGVGVYVLAGDVAKNYAGPAVILSFLLAAVASVFAGLCYAEFGARVPKAGSAYVYSYVCVGEFIAFIIGWNLILEYIIGAASVVKALSEYLDSLLNKAISTHLEAVMPLDTPHLARYPDIFAFFVIMAFSVALAFGVKESTKFNNFCTGVNLCVVLFVIISGCFKADTKNWRIPASEVPKSETKDFGSGGFAPYGLAGIIKGAAVCFYGFIGFDCVATAGEEARRPQKTIPFAVVASLLVVFLAYCGVSSVLTLMLPYYMQDEKAPFPFVYDQLGWNWAKYAVSVGAICALCSSLLGAVFPLPRIIYAMASDGLLFKFMGKVSERFQTPLIGTMIAGLFTGTLAMIFELEQLIHMMSIGTLLAYSMVASCVLLLRYERSLTAQRTAEPLNLSVRSVLRQVVNADGHPTPTRLSSATVTALVTMYGVWCFIMMSSINQYGDEILAGKPGPIAMLAVGSVLVVSTLCAISRQPVSEKKLAFSVPLVPWLPGVSILINVYLMLNLDYMTWVRFGVWIAMVINDAVKLRSVPKPNVPEDGRLDFVGLATKYGANVEEHDIVTDDGYILKLFHLLGDRTRPVLLNHGVIQSSDTFILRGNTSLAIQLVRRGYDVWLLNVRGNRYSRRHLSLNPDVDDKFWDFSFVEFGKLDMPATIDYILLATGQKRLSVIGFSQGTTAIYALGILKPKYNDKVKIHVSLAPICYMHNTRSLMSSLIEYGPYINQGLVLSNSNEFAGFYSQAKKIFDALCAQKQVGYDLCLLGILFPLTGFDISEIEEQFFHVAMGHIPAGTSRKNLYHLAQTGLNKVFAHFDYGPEQNKVVYGTNTPTKLNLTKVTMNTALIVGKNDRISTVKDVNLLRKKLSNVVKYVESDTFAHMSFVWGRNTHRLMFPTIFELLEKYQ